MVEEGNVYWVNWTNNGGGSGSRENSSRSSENNFNNNNERSGENGSRWGRGRSNVKCQFVPKLIIYASMCYILENLFGGNNGNKPIARGIIRDLMESL